MTTSTETVSHKVCMVFRRYPSAVFWLMTCGAFAAGVVGSLVALGGILLLELAVGLHIVSRTYGRTITTSSRRKRDKQQ